MRIFSRNSFSPRMRQRIPATEHRSIECRHLIISILSLTVGIQWITWLLQVSLFSFLPFQQPVSPRTGSHVSTSSSSLSSRTPCGDLQRGIPGMDEANDVLWQQPVETCDTRPPRAIFFLAHGCNHKMSDWFSRHPVVCPECLGLPEERAIVQMGLDRNFVVVAISSIGRCWSKEADGRRVISILQGMQNLLDDTHPSSPLSLPIIAFGASSGGFFVATALPKLLHEMGTTIHPVGGSSNVMVAPSTTEKVSITKATTFTDHHPRRFLFSICGFISQVMVTAPGAYIPGTAVWITMSRDKPSVQAAEQLVRTNQKRQSLLSSSSSRLVRGSRNRIRTRGVGDEDDEEFAPGGGVYHIPLYPLPITDQYFSDRIGAAIVSPTDSMRLTRALRDATPPYLNETGYLLRDPRHSDWREVIGPVLPKLLTTSLSWSYDSLQPDHSAISEILNVAWGRHELSRDGVSNALDLILHSIGKC